MCEGGDFSVPADHYVHAAAGDLKTILLRNDGAAVIFGLEEENPQLLKRFGGQWIHAAASRTFIIVIDQDGKAIACCDEGDYPAHSQ